MTNLDPFITIRRELHKIPELGYKEFKTQKYLLDYINSLLNENISVSTWETGIFVFLKGKKPSQTIGFRADIDGLPIKEETNLPFSSKHINCMHACGHDFHMSIALGILTHFSHHPIDDHLLFIFQPAEEGPGGALPMLNSRYFIDHKPDKMFALHIAPEYPIGVVATKTGILFANSCEVKISLKGKKGHAAFPHLANDMIVAGSSLVSQLQTVISRNTNPLDSAVITFGKMHAGSANNIISDLCELHGTLRSLSKESMKILKERVKDISNGIALSFDCDVTIEFLDEYLQVNNDEILTNRFIDFLVSRTNVRFVEAPVAMTAEDFGYFIDQVPGFMFWLGVDSESGLHTSSLNPKEEAIPFAIELCIDFIKNM